MTDEQIVRTLAEFMNLGESETELAVFKATDPGTFEVEHHWNEAPGYLFSYDALAPVFKKFHNTVDSALAIRRCEANYWFDDEPKELAEALATAIQQAKEQR